MSRKLISKARGYYVGEFPPKDEGGWTRARRGPRRNLIKIEAVEHLDVEERNRLLYRLYQEKLREYEDEIKQQDWQKEKARREARACSISKALERWVKGISTINSPLTVKDYRRSIELYLQFIGDHKLSDFNLDHNYAYIQALKEHKNRGKSLSNTTIHKHVRHLGVFLKWAYDNDIVKKQFNLKNVRVHQKDMETVDLDTIHYVIDETIKRAQSAKDKADRLKYKNLVRAMIMAKTCLLRAGAIWALPLQNIDLKNRVVCIRSVKELGWVSKSYKEPNKPINDELFEFLEEDLKERNPEERWYLDKGNGEQWRKDRGDISREASELLKELGIKNIKPFHHFFRASVMTEMINLGVDLHAVQEIADHSSITTTMKYSDSRRINQRKAVDAIPRKPKPKEE